MSSSIVERDCGAWRRFAAAWWTLGMVAARVLPHRGSLAVGLFFCMAALLRQLPLRLLTDPAVVPQPAAFVTFDGSYARAASLGPAWCEFAEVHRRPRLLLANLFW